MQIIDAVFTTQDVVIPNAPSFNQYDLQLINQADGSVVQDLTVPLGTLTASFLNVAPGDYIVQVAIMDSQGTIGAPYVSTAVTVPVEPTAPVPVSISVTLRSA